VLSSNHRNRRKSLTILLVVFLFQSGWTYAFSGEKLKVATTFTVIADMARNVAGDAAIVESITKPNAEIHNYQTTPSDIRRVHDADLILYNGLNLELWFDRFFKNFKNIPKIEVSSGVQPISISGGPYRGKPNPHAWMSLENALIYIDNIRQALIELDSQNAAIYDANANRYSAQLKASIEPLRKRLERLPEKNRWLVTSEGAFSYLARDHSLQELFLWPINADGQGTPQQVRRVIDRVRKHQIIAVFSESTVSSKPARQVARETGAKYAGVLYVDSLSGPDGPVPTYIDLMKITLLTIADGLDQ